MRLTARYARERLVVRSSRYCFSTGACGQHVPRRKPCAPGMRVLSHRMLANDGRGPPNIGQCVQCA